jgi:hypothetical protein
MSDASPTASQRITARRFTTLLLVTAAAVVLGCGLFNAVVDPYGLFRWMEQPGFNAIKPRATQASTAFKYRVIDLTLPQTLLIGNSRVEMGWDPELLPSASFGRVANVALPGQGLSSMVAMADHAWARSAPSTLVIGLEFFDCLEAGQAPPLPAQSASPWSVVASGPTRRIERMSAFAGEALSLDTTVDSLQTLLSQRNPNAAHLRRDGFQPARDYPRMQAIEGPRKLFVQRDQENARMRMNGSKTIRYANGQLSDCFAELDRLLANAQAHGQVVYLATYPYHARLLELLVNAGLWQAFEEWKVVLTELVASRRQGGLKVQLRDFAAYHTYATEPIPGPDQTKPVPQWYWESGHFRRELGARMLDVMFGKQPADELFGAELVPDSLAKHMDSVRASRLRFAKAQPQVVAEMETLAKRARRPSPADNAGRGCR